MIGIYGAGVEPGLIKTTEDFFETGMVVKRSRFCLNRTRWGEKSFLREGGGKGGFVMTW